MRARALREFLAPENCNICAYRAVALLGNVVGVRSDLYNTLGHVVIAFILNYPARSIVNSLNQRVSASTYGSAPT